MIAHHAGSLGLTLCLSAWPWVSGQASRSNLRLRGKQTPPSQDHPPKPSSASRTPDLGLCSFQGALGQRQQQAQARPALSRSPSAELGSDPTTGTPGMGHPHSYQARSSCARSGSWSLPSSPQAQPSPPVPSERPSSRTGLSPGFSHFPLLSSVSPPLGAGL